MCEVSVMVEPPAVGSVNSKITLAICDFIYLCICLFIFLMSGQHLMNCICQDSSGDMAGRLKCLTYHGKSKFYGNPFSLGAC